MLAEAPGGELAYSLDGGNVVANGKLIGTVSQLPSSVGNTFARFKLHSVTLKLGVTAEELSAFCELAGLRPEQAKGVQASDFIAQKGVSHITLNEAVYSKVEKSEDAPLPDEVGVEALVQAAASDAPIDATIAELVRVAVKDPTDQARVLEAVMRRLRDDIEKRVNEATTELKRQKQTLEGEATRTQGVLEGIAEGVVVVDEQGKVLTMNPEAENVFGSRLSEMAGKPVAHGAKDEHLVAMAKDLTIPTDRPPEKEAELKATDDTRRTLRASTVVIQNEAGKPVGMVSALSDKAKQREFDRMEREFIAHVTHELRSPLTSIKAALEIMEGMVSGKLDDEGGRMFRTAQRNTERLEVLINSILDFSKIESGQMTVLPERSGAAKIAAEAVESMRPWTLKKGLRVELADRASGAEVLADVPRTVQVMVNLLSNAIKFTPSGGSINVTVSPAPGSQEPAVLYSVKDSGPGIAKDQQEKVFEKFVQIASGERHVGGTGLGLAIAKALVHLQKGKMWIESEPGRGADFRFTLPVYKAPTDTAAVRPKAVVKSWWQKLLGL
ncbi:MAG: two-component hybrid sensor and regulator [Elusimicrobia bacterium]|nr:MAG: two-component hybrid sensor and regulator [Elusimicrobiota bacterium]